VSTKFGVIRGVLGGACYSSQLPASLQQQQQQQQHQLSLSIHQ